MGSRIFTSSPVASLVSIVVVLCIAHFSCSVLRDKDFRYPPWSSEIETKSVYPSEENAERSSNESEEKNTNRSWMNSGGIPYGIANAPDFDTEWILKDPTVMFFESYSRPIRSLYSQVHWTSHGSIPLPEDVVRRYNGSDQGESKSDTIAVVGYEIDQVRIDPTTGQEVSVPITWAYNHHYGAFLMGEKKNGEAVSMVEVPSAEAMKYGSSRMTMGHMTAAADTSVRLPGILYENQPILTEDNSDYSWAFFSEGNGGECRKSYHSYPKGYAQLIRKPHSFSVDPMQIDTWNRETMNSSEFAPPRSNVQDYFPRTSKISSRLLDNLAEAKYNPLLECPCTDRLPKTSGMTYKLVPTNNEPFKEEEQQQSLRVTTTVSGGLLDNSTECFHAANQLLSSTNITKKVIPGDNDQGGICEAVVRIDGSLEVVWNTAENKKQTVAAIPESSRVGSIDLVVGTTPLGSLINATLVLNTTRKEVDITLKGPYLEDETDERWFAIGLGANSMCIQMQADECTTGGPYAIIVLPPEKNSASRVVERKLDYHGAGRILQQRDSQYDIAVYYNKIEIEAKTGKKRRVVRLTRPLEGPTNDYYSFPNSNPEKSPLQIILAKGCPGTSQFGRHCGHQSPEPISFARVNYWQEIKRDGIKGKIGGKHFEKACKDEPMGDLVKQENPTCTLEAYQGGLSCCVHDEFLLDKNQTIPWKDQVLEYRLKFRFYYQDYVEGTHAAEAASLVDTSDSVEANTGAMAENSHLASHLDLARFYWQTEIAAGEYDVPECDNPSDPYSCVHVITSRWKVEDFGETGHFPADDDCLGIELIYAGPHCHAPTCLSMELYNDDTGELLCRVEPHRGKGRNHKNNSSKEAFDEAGFLAIPPCIWSHREGDGLVAPAFLSRNTTLLSIKRANSTYLHTGEMASWQMRGIFVYNKDGINTKEIKENTTLTSSSSSPRSHRKLCNP